METLSAADVPQILQVLLHALDHDVSVQKRAEATLAHLEHRTGFCSCMVAILATPGADHSARWLASVQLKNNVAKHWGHRPNQRGVTPEEKAYLRQRLVALVAQEDQQIAVQVAVTLAKAARADYPREWPTLFADLLGQLKGGGSLTVRRVYFTLHHVLKELSSKRLAADQRNFEEVARQLFDHAWSEWQADTRAIGASLGAIYAGQVHPGQPVLVHCERWLLLLKITRRLVLFGFPSDARSLQPAPAVGVVAPALLSALTALTAARPPAPPKTQALAMLDRGVLKLVKTLTQLMEVHPWSFAHAGALQGSLEWCCSQALAASPTPTAGAAAAGAGGGARGALAMRCLLHLLAALQSDAYKGRSDSALGARQRAQHAAAVEAMASEVSASLAQFWSPQRLTSLTQALVALHIRLTPRELAEWEEDAEAFAHSQEGGGPQEGMRPAAEAVLLELLASHRDVVAAAAVQLLHAASSACPVGVPPEQLPGSRVHGVPEPMLLKEATYRAAAVGAYHLHDAVDFGPWLESTLLREMAVPGRAARVLRRASATVVGAWVARLTPRDRPGAYAALAALLSDEDAAVQLAAVAALRSLVDDFGFEAAAFVAYVEPTLRALGRVLTDSTELDSQTQVFALLLLIVERMGLDILPFLPTLLPLLPEVWASGEGQSLLRIQVLSALQLVVNVLGSSSPQAYPLLLPLLRHALDPVGSREPELLEDGLLLWLVALRNAPGGSGGGGGGGAASGRELLALFPLLCSVMAASTEHIGVNMSLCFSCILLGGAPFLGEFGGALVGAWAEYLGAVRERGMLLLLPPMDLLLVSFPVEGAQLLMPALQKLLALLLSGSESATVVANSLHIFARLLTLNRPAFEALLGSCAAAGVQPPPSYSGAPGAPPAERLLGALAELWCERFDAVALPLARKLSALGLTTLLGLPSGAVLPLLDVVVSHVAGVWAEVEASGQEGPDGTLYCGSIYTTGRSDEDGLGSPCVLQSEEAEGEGGRRAALMDAEPLRRVSVSAFLREQLGACAAVHGPGFQAAMSAMDPSVMAQLQAVMGGGSSGSGGGGGG